VRGRGALVEFNFGKGDNANNQYYRGVDYERLYPLVDVSFHEGVTRLGFNRHGSPLCAVREFRIAESFGIPLAVYCREPKKNCSTTLIFREFLIAVVPMLEQGFSTMSAWISVAPLLGLLGTVAGMIQTFRVITTFGLGNPNLTAEGISVALLTTQAGLTVAFPMVLFHNFLLNRSRSIKSRLLKDGEALVNKVKAREA
jgi:hypothetical protein